MKNYLISFSKVVLLLALLTISIFTNFNNIVASEEKDSKSNHIIPLDSEKSLISSESSESPSNFEIPTESLIAHEKINEQVKNSEITIEEMKKEYIKEFDKNTNHITDNLEKKIRQKSFEKDQIVSIIITTKTIMVKDDITLFEALGGVTRHVWDDPTDVVCGFSGEIDVSKLIEFTCQLGSNVELVEENMPTIRNSDVATHLAMVRTHVWDNLNYSGDPNLAVAILDTGIDDSHTAFSPGYEDLNWSKKIVGWYDTTNDGSTTPDDYIGHGSHVAGIVAANEYNDSYSNGRIVSTWSYSYDPRGSLSGAFPYTLWVNRTGTIDISYVWRGEKSAEGTYLALYAPNGTLMDSDTSVSSNRTVTCTLTSEADFGYWEVALGVSWGAEGGMIDVAGVNKYPYPDPTDNHSRFAGVAPDVKLVGVKIFNKTGNGKADDVIEAFNWVKNNKDTYHIAIASGSFGFSGTVGSVNIAAAVLVNSGVTVVLSAGNNGQGRNSIYSPGEVDGVITVAASDDYNKITRYSSEGPGNVSNTTKPDITAPGGESTQGAILQVDSNDADSKNYTWSDKFPNDFTNIQGTSMSCPFVSGSLALLIQAMGGYDFWNNGYGTAINPYKVKQLILMTANEIYLDDRGGKDPVEGYGKLNIYAAIEAIENTYVIGTRVDETLSFDLGKRNVWAENVTMTTGTNYTFKMSVPDDADFDLFIYEPNPNQFGEPVIAASSTNFEPGADEYITFTPPVSGTYYLVVKSSFTNTGAGTFYLSSTSGKNFPIVSIVSPTENERLTGECKFQIDVFDSDLKAVYFKVASDSWINTTFGGTYYEYTYNTTALPDGNFSFVVKAIDDQGDITYSTIHNIYTDNYKQPILLVDDDIGSSNEKYYERALKKLSLDKDIDYDLYGINTSGSPSIGKLMEYQLVIWFTSTDFQTTLTSTDQNNLQSYLDHGGYLWISGQDIGFDINTTSFYENYLHAVYENDTIEYPLNRYVIGLSGEIFDGKRYFVGYGAGSWQHASPSIIDANTGASVILCYYNNSEYGAAIKYSGTHKVMYFAFNWEAIDDESDRINSFNRSINWFNLDEAPFSVTVISPINGSITNNNPSFSWTGKDDYGIEKYAIFRDGIYLETTTETSITLNGQPKGWHCYRIVAFDEKNQSKGEKVVIFVDTTPPVIIINSPLNTTYSISTISILTSNQSIVHTAWYRYWNGSWSNNYTMLYNSESQRWEVEGLTWLDGSYSLQIFFNDSVGNEANSQEWFSVDTTAPIVIITSPNNITYTTTSVAIYASNTTRVYKAWCRYRNGTWSNNYSMIYNPTAIRWEIEELTWIDGYYSVQVFFNDSVGNEAYSQEWFAIDTIPPIISLENPDNESILTSDTLIVIVVTDSDLDTVLFHWNDNENQTWTSPYETSVPINDTEHTLFIYANDTSDNWSTNKYIFTTDNIEPKITLLKYQNMSVLPSGTIISLEINDTHLDTVIYNWDRSQNTTWITYETAMPEGYGQHVLYVYANDTAGNWIIVRYVFLTYGKETTEISSEQTSSQEESTSVEGELLTNTSEDTQTVLVPGEVTVGIVLGVLFGSIGLIFIIRRLARRRFSSE
ncbi:MAG: S8 family serine peptidase [Promethearchaeota archaeon]